MFDANELERLDSKYFTVIYKDIYDVSSALRDCGCDDAEYGDPSSSVQRFNEQLQEIYEEYHNNCNRNTDGILVDDKECDHTH